MTGIAFGLLLQVTALGAGDTSSEYAQAYKDTETTGRPLMVLISADWCPACRSLKNGTIANLKNQGELKDVNFTTVNTDRQPKLAAKMMRGGTIPQLVVYTKTDGVWKSVRLTGSQGGGQVRDLIRRAVQLRRNN